MPAQQGSRQRSTQRAAPQQLTGFDFTGHVRRLCADVTERVAEFRHIDMQRVAISFSQARKRVLWGTFATTTPMRFENGSLFTRRHGRTYTVQRLYNSQGREMLYIISFYLPRFMDIEYREKLITIFHELWHVSPEFNGDLRRYSGRCYAHTHSQDQYDRQMGQFVDRYLQLDPPAPLFSFLRYNYQQLYELHRGVYGTRVVHPKLIPVGD